MPHVLQLDPNTCELRFNEAVAQFNGSLYPTLVPALLAMQPAEKMDMMRPPTARSFLIKEIAQADYDALVTVLAEINQALGGEVLRSAARSSATEGILQAKILLGDKKVVKSVEVIQA